MLMTMTIMDVQSLCYMYVGVMICNYNDLKNDLLFSVAASTNDGVSISRVIFSLFFLFFLLFLSLNLSPISICSYCVKFFILIQFPWLAKKTDFSLKVWFFSSSEQKRIHFNSKGNVFTVEQKKFYRKVCKLLELTVRSKISPQYFSESVS